MFPIHPLIPIIFFGFLILVAFALSVLLALALNAICKTPLRLLLVSSGLVGVFGFLVALAGVIFLPGQLSWSNAEPQNLRTMVWDHSIAISGIFALVFIISWQSVARRKS